MTNQDSYCRQFTMFCGKLNTSLSCKLESDLTETEFLPHRNVLLCNKADFTSPAKHSVNESQDQDLYVLSQRINFFTQVNKAFLTIKWPIFLNAFKRRQSMLSLTQLVSSKVNMELDKVKMQQACITLCIPSAHEP